MLDAVMTTADIAGMLGCCKKTVERLDARAAIPYPIYIGSLKRWRRSEIADWIAAGAPPRERWEVHKDANLPAESQR